MLTIRGRLITPFVLGSMSVGLSILIRHSFIDLWVWITVLVPWPQLLKHYCYKYWLRLVQTILDYLFNSVLGIIHFTKFIITEKYISLFLFICFCFALALEVFSQLHCWCAGFRFYFCCVSAFRLQLFHNQKTKTKKKKQKKKQKKKKKTGTFQSDQLLIVKATIKLNKNLIDYICF